MNDTHDIVKANALINASFNPGTRIQMQLIHAGLVQIKAGETLSPERVFSVSANALADMGGTAARSHYRHLAAAAAAMRSMFITVALNPDGTDRGRRRREINLVQHVDYIEGEGRVEWQFTNSIIPYISQLREKFTKIRAEYIMPMRSQWGMRLYELALAWLGGGDHTEREFHPDNLRHILGLDGKYRVLKDFKTRVIFPAIEDINCYSDLRVKFGQVKAGRWVIGLQFDIRREGGAGGRSKTSPRRLAKTPPGRTDLNPRPGESLEAYEARLARRRKQAR
jgi:plasmid replication initiation protein